MGKIEVTDEERELIVHCLRAHAKGDRARYDEIRNSIPGKSRHEKLAEIFERQSIKEEKLADRLEA